jgi:hypothetical protein
MNGGKGDGPQCGTFWRKCRPTGLWGAGLCSPCVVSVQAQNCSVGTPGRKDGFSLRMGSIRDQKAWGWGLQHGVLWSHSSSFTYDSSSPHSTAWPAWALVSFIHPAVQCWTTPKALPLQNGGKMTSMGTQVFTDPRRLTHK